MFQQVDPTLLVISCTVVAVALILVGIPSIVTYFLIRNAIAPRAITIAKQVVEEEPKHTNPDPFEVSFGEYIFVSHDCKTWYDAIYRDMQPGGVIAVTTDHSVVGGMFKYYKYGKHRRDKQEV